MLIFYMFIGIISVIILIWSTVCLISFKRTNLKNVNIKTRIRFVRHGSRFRFYPEYYSGVFDYWLSVRRHFLTTDYVNSLEEAKLRIDDFIKRRQVLRQKQAESAELKKIKPKTTYIKYP